MKNTVNTRVKTLRNKLNLSQTEFSAIAEISGSLLSKIEIGAVEPTHKTLERISETWEVPMDWLLHGKGELAFKKAPSKSVSNFDPATDTLYKELREQIVFYRELLTQMAGGKRNFLQALNQTGLSKNKRLGAAA